MLSTAKTRVIPDVAMTADPNNSVYVVYGGRWKNVGGTSVSAPLMAGILSLVNQTRFNANKSGLTTVSGPPPRPKASSSSSSAKLAPNIPSNHLQTYLYQKMYTAKTKYTAGMIDITHGADKGSSASSVDTLTTFYCGTGYDVATGLGAPNARIWCREFLNA